MFITLLGFLLCFTKKLEIIVQRHLINHMSSPALGLLKRGIANVWIEPVENDIASQLYLIKQDRMAAHPVRFLLKRLESLEKKDVPDHFLKEEIFVEKAYLQFLIQDLKGFKKTLNQLENLPSKPLYKVSFLEGIRAFREKRFKDAIFHFKKVITNNPSKLYLGKSCNNLGLLFHKLDPPSAEHFYNKAIESFQFLKNSELEFQTKENLVSLYKSMQKRSEAISMLLEIMEHNKQIHAMDRLAQNHHTLGVLHEKEGNFEKALSNYTKALAIRENMDDQLASSWTYLKLARLYLQMGEISKAFEMSHKSLLIREKQGSKEEMAQSLQTLALVYIQLGDNENAKSCMKQAVDLFLETANEEWISESTFHLAQFLLKEQALEEAKNLAHIHSQLAKSTANRSIKQRNRLLEAILLKNSESPKSMFEALEILEDLLQEPLDDIELKLQAMIEIIDLYLLELKIINPEKPLRKIENLLSQMLDSSLTNQSFTIYVHFLIIKARLKRAQFKGEEALNLLKEAEIVCNEKRLNYLKTIIDQEMNELQTHLSDMWETLQYSNADLIERMQKTALKEYLEKVTEMLRISKDQSD